METIKLSSETRKRRIDPNSNTTMHDDDPPRRLRSALPESGPRPRWILPVAAALVVCGILYGVYRLGVSRGSQNTVANTDGVAPSAAASTRVLLLDPVCKRAVDPANAPAILDFNGKSIYFDSLDCLNAFRSDPVKYGAGRVMVKAHIQTDREGTADASSASPATPSSPSSAGSPEGDLVPGGPPEPPGTDSAEPSAPAPSSKDDAPPGDAPLTHAPEAAPEQAPEPKSRSVSDAPAVTESYPSQPPTDLPAKAPKVPDMGEKTHTGASKPASSAKTSAKTTTTLPKTAPPSAPTDPNGFSLPPELKEGPPPRKPGGSAKKPAARQNSGDAPSVNESDDMH